MSASEKLKALDERHQGGITVTLELVGVPFPQIVEVVEAAEDLIGVSESLDERVAALEEALT